MHRIEMVVTNRIAALIEIEDLAEADRRTLAHGIVGMAEGACRR